MLKLKLILILLILPILSFGQYPIVEEFDSFGGAGEWTVDNGGGVQNYGGIENYATFNLGSTPYNNSTVHTLISPIYDFSNCIGDITISFPIEGIIENGYDFLLFEYFDGIWNTSLILSGVQLAIYTNNTIPNTTTQFRFRLVTDASLILWYRNNGNYSFINAGPFNTPVDVSNSYVSSSNPITTNVYFYDISRFTIDCSTPLPIELLIFDCGLYGSDIELYWTTASQINNDFFIVEHSIDGHAWNTINIINGSGNSNQMEEYSVFHRDAPNGTNYYRLTQVDFDGESETFNIVTCTRDGEEKEVKIIKYYNNIGQDISKPLSGYFLEVIWYKDGTQRVNKRFIIKN